MTRSRTMNGAARSTILPRPAAEWLEPRRLLAVFTVTTTADEGPGSLRQAILDANALAGSDEVRFALGSGLQVIQVRSALPDVTDALTIDGTPPQGPSPQPSVRIDARTFLSVNGLTLRASATVRALAVTRFGGAGVVFAEGGGRLEGCYVGVAPVTTNGGPDSLDAGNFGGGVAVNTPGVTIGGTQPSQRNVISANSGPGIRVSGGNGAVIEGNLIGTNAGGTRPQSNGFGIVVESSTGVRIGGTTPGAGNVISGNIGDGVGLRTTASDVAIQGNFIGTDFSGAAAIPNGGITSGGERFGVGVSVLASNVTIGGAGPARNLISANPLAGVVVNTALRVRIGGNYIGTDVSGTARLGDQLYGVRVTGTSGVELGPTPRRCSLSIHAFDGHPLRARNSRQSSSAWILILRCSRFSDALHGATAAEAQPAPMTRRNVT